MPSIFIWKADTPSVSKKTIRYYSGPNWALEDNEISSKSYMYLDQMLISSEENAISECTNSVITFNAKVMPRDWVGSNLLEVSCIPYEEIKSDNYGTLERIGEWLRFTPKQEIDFEETVLKLEFNKIKKWMAESHQKLPRGRTPVPSYGPKNNSIKSYKKDIIKDTVFDPVEIQHNFQNFLNKYQLPTGSIIH